MARRIKRDTRSPIERAIDGRRDANRDAWARQHPDLAGSERALRKARAELLERWKHKNEGTAETHEQASRRNQGALAHLYKNGAIDAEQLGSAVEIATVAERIASDVAVKTASLETRVDTTRLGDGSFFERLGQVRREAAYTRWRDAARMLGPPRLGSGQAIAAVLDMIVGNHIDGGPVGFTIVASRYGMHNRRAKQLLISALDLWPAALGEACKAIDEQALNAAHARLAA